MLDKIDYALCDKFQFVIDSLTNKGINAAKVFFNYCILLTIVNVVYYLLRIGIEVQKQIDAHLWIDIVFLLVSIYVTTIQFTIGFYQLSKYIDNHIEDGMMARHKDMYKGELAGAIWRIFCVIQLVSIPSDIIGAVHDISNSTNGTTYFAAIVKFLAIFCSISYAIISLASGCDYRKPKSPKVKFKKTVESYNAA